ncbi:MAG: hypothetical protein FWG30_09755 [Eubacteriaceae bacterium]|nr:hypothetical protein [Eubacteriaceae bacterium]
MDSIVIYYSFSGNTRKIAEGIAASEGADILEVKDAQPVGKLKAYTSGIFAARGGKQWPIQPVGKSLESYSRFILLAPIWASNPAPAFNTLLNMLPEGKTVAVKMVSMSGKSNCKERIQTAISAKMGVLESFEDIKA